MNKNSQPSARDLLPYERLVLETILSQEFQGRDSLARQIDQARVVTVDAEGSIKFIDPGLTYVPVAQTVPLEAFYTDADGGIVHALLHIDRTGRLVELEFYREDSNPILSKPTQETLKLY